MTDWQDLVEWMHSPEVREAVARYAEEPEAEGEAVQAALWEREDDLSKV